MSDRTMVNVSFPNDTIAQIDRLCANVNGGPPTRRASWVAWAVAQYIALLTKPAPPAKPRRSPAADVRRGMKGGCHACMEISATGHSDANGLPHTCSRAAHEGARLKAARGAAGLTQAELGAAVSTESAEVSRQQVDRAERAASLDQWPTLRAWLLEHDAPTPT